MLCNLRNIRFLTEHINCLCNNADIYLYIQCKRFKANNSQKKDENLIEEEKVLKTENLTKDPPENNNPKSMKHCGFELPEGVPAEAFRFFTQADEPLGPNASKSNTYKNAEYYAYHRYSFINLQTSALNLRQKRIDDRGVQKIYERDESSCSEGESSS